MIKQISNNSYLIPFTGYKSVLKSYWKQGKLPTVTRDLYGDILTKENCSIDHLIPRSKGGESILENYALATIGNNFQRGNTSLKEYKDKLKLGDYLAQFIFIKLPNFDGEKYVMGVLNTFQKIFAI